MDEVDQKIHKIRDLVNHPWKQHTLLRESTVWNKLCASMDVIEDTQIAIRSFFNLSSFSAETGGYLYLYGLLQALFLQQDALNHLSEALFNKTYKWDEQYPDLYTIRELRNDTVGHPTKRGKDQSFHFLARYSVSKGSFRLMSYFTKTNDTLFKDILSTLQGLADVVRRIDYIINKIGYWIDNRELKNNDDAEVFMDSFSDRLDELQEMLKEIDLEFS